MLQKIGTNFFVSVIFLFSAHLTATIHYSHDPRTFPYSFIAEDEYTPRTFVTDLDTDGRDEIIIVDYPNGSADKSFILCYTSDHQDKWQKHIRNPITGNLQFFDLNNDGSLEILVPICYNNSLYSRIFDKDGHDVGGFVLASGKPRIENDRILDWDPDLIKMFQQDLDGDNVAELISIISTGIARQPRGVLVHSITDHHLLGSCFIGSPPSSVYAFDDFNKDGKYELVFLTSAPGNGANVNGLDDSQCNLVRMEFNPQPVLRDWHCISKGKFSSAHGFYVNFSGDDSPEFITIRCAGNSNESAQIQIFDPVNFSSITTHDLNFSVKSAIVHQSMGEKFNKIWALTSNNELKIINNLFHVEVSEPLPVSFAAINLGPDIDLDGIDEVIMANSSHSILVNHSLESLAYVPGFQFLNYVKKGTDQKQFMIQNHTTNVYRLDRNQFHLLYRYRAQIIFALPICAFLVVTILLVITYHEKKTLDFAFRHLYSVSNGAAAIVDSFFKIKRYNQDFETLLSSISITKTASLSPLLKKSGRSFDRLSTWLKKTDDLSFEKEFYFESDQYSTILKIEMIRLPRIRFAKRLYLVTLKDLSVESEKERAQHWTLLARRIVHDIKNPLGSIILVVQRIRNRLGTNAKQQHDILPYLDKIEGRIESLRVMTRNLLKFANLEELHLTITNFNLFVETVVRKICLGLPPDIELKLDLTTENPSLFADQEQLESVIENLCNNAIDSMPEGGALTISTRLAYQLQIKSSDENIRDYAVVEIHDTGSGIPEEIKDRLFESNFSYSKKSSGLGLAIVKKIIDDHHGFVDIESEEGVGSIFTIYLPLIQTVEKKQHNVENVVKRKPAYV